jgi:hypothetical protein
MIVLKEVETHQEIRIMGRDDRINIITLTDEQTNVTTELNPIVFSDAGYYLFTEVTLDFLEAEHTYKLKAYYSATNSLNDADLAYSDLVFVTNQDIIDNSGIYDINKDRYTDLSINNEYKIYE